MLKFTSEQDLSRLPKDNPAHPIISELVQRLITETYKTDYPYDPDADGFIVLIEPEDVDRPLTDIWPDGEWKLTDLLWENFSKHGDFFLGIYLANNQWGLAAIIPDADWVTGELRECIEQNLDPVLPEQQLGDLYD